MKQRPISFSTDMVKALLEGRKTMTRRKISDKYIINQEPGRYKFHGFDDNDDACFEDLKPEITPWMTPIPCPYGKINDILYVRESYYQFGYWIQDGSTKKGNQKWKFIGYDDDIRYSENPPGPEDYLISRDKDGPGYPQWYKRLGRFMPKKYARTFLEITDIGVERVKDVNLEDIKAEGVQVPTDEYGRIIWTMGEGDNSAFSFYRKMFDINGDIGPTEYQKFFAHWAELWCKINGRASWDANPWLWVVSFKVLSTTGKPAEEMEHLNNQQNGNTQN